MTTYLRKRCSFGLPRVPFVNCRQFMYLVISLFGFEGRMWDLIVSVPDHCLSFYFEIKLISVLGKMCKNLLVKISFTEFLSRHKLRYPQSLKSHLKRISE